MRFAVTANEGVVLEWQGVDGSEQPRPYPHGHRPIYVELDDHEAAAALVQAYGGQIRVSYVDTWREEVRAAGRAYRKAEAADYTVQIVGDPESSTVEVPSEHRLKHLSGPEARVFSMSEAQVSMFVARYGDTVTCEAVA